MGIVTSTLAGADGTILFECISFPAYNFSMADQSEIHTGICEDIGLRRSMEDEHAIYQNPEKGFFSAEVYDGHGGRSAAQVAAEMVTPYFLHEWSRESEKALKDRTPEYELLRNAYLAVDRHIVENGLDSGTTAAGIYLIHDHFFAANCGDTRIVIGTRHGVSTLTLDHKPDLPDELQRIEMNGGHVISVGVARVQGILAVSRAIGDRSLKPHVIAEPRITEGYLGRDNDFIVIACDGVWDVLSPDIVIAIVRAAADVQAAAENIRTTAIDSGSTDNITIIVLGLKEYTAGFKRKKMEITTVVDRALPRAEGK
jgi:serine/threonine protein phosphatase PrpC